MKSYSDEVNELLIFQKWRDSAALIAFRLIFGSFELQVFARVEEAAPERVLLRILGDKVGWFSFDPSEAILRYQDPRESDPAVKLDVESKVVCALSVILPVVEGKADSWLYEWREGVEP
jgi:hypothetical protein